MITPIIIPIATPPRSCIVVDGHRYCQNEPLTPHIIGAICLMFLCAIGWLALFAYFLIERDKPLVGWSIFLAPFIVGSSLLFLN